MKIVSDKEGNGIYSRSIFFEEENNQYTKKWHKDFFYRKYFEFVYRNTDFFKENSTIISVLEEDGCIVGYATTGGKEINYYNIDKNKYDELRKQLIASSLKWNVVYLDLVIKNVIELNGKYYIVDLEPTIPFAEIKEIPRLKTIWEYNDYYYRKELNKNLSIDDNIIVRQGTNPDKEINYGTADGRVFLEQEYLPALNGSVLFVGVNYYNDFYHQLVKEKERFETVDILESAIEHGSPYKHYVCNILDFRVDCRYDNVVCFGLFGHADSSWEITTSRDDILTAIGVLNDSLVQGGRLLFAPATQTLSDDFWNEIFNTSVLKTYKDISIKKIGINRIFIGTK